MNPHASIGLAATICLSLVSCYPYDESHNRRKVIKAESAGPTASEIKRKEEEAKRKKEEEKIAETTNPTTTPSEPQGTTGPDSITPPKPPTEKSDYPFANKVPNKEGFVFSPYNSKIVDVRDIPSGTLVQDPTYPAADKKYFRVP